MKVNLLGYQPLHFKNATGEEVNGTNIYVAFEDSNVTGFKADRFFLREEISLPKDTKINDCLDVEFNQKGKIISITKA